MLFPAIPLPVFLNTLTWLHVASCWALVALGSVIGLLALAPDVSKPRWAQSRGLGKISFAIAVGGLVLGVYALVAIVVYGIVVLAVWRLAGKKVFGAINSVSKNP